MQDDDYFFFFLMIFDLGMYQLIIDYGPYTHIDYQMLYALRKYQHEISFYQTYYQKHLMH